MHCIISLVHGHIYQVVMNLLIVINFKSLIKSLPNLSGLLKFLHDNMELDTFELFKRKQMKIMSTCTHFHTHTKSLSDGDPRGKRKAQDSSH